LADAAAPFSAPPDCGILLIGESGAGKSEAALRLLERGAMLVADDRVILFERDCCLWAEAPAVLSGLLEVRGVGIVKVPSALSARIGLAVELVRPERVPRLPERIYFEPPEGLARDIAARPPLLRLATDATLPVKIVVAAAAFANALFREEINPL
jgi:serine kinase of HPr protein (carbohydrate metabolism regulator)